MNSWCWVGTEGIGMKCVINLEHHFMPENKEVLKGRQERVEDSRKPPCGVFTGDLWSKVSTRVRDVTH